jgi:hypothetical protein
LVPFHRSDPRHNPVSELYGQFLRPHGLVFALTCTVNCRILYRQPFQIMYNQAFQIYVYNNAKGYETGLNSALLFFNFCFRGRRKL